ncbi:MAG: NAD(P)-binding domain-containing protein, partial [Dermatophilaceae bacterium]
LTLTDGSQLSSPYAVVATGFNHTPVTPDYPGLAGFTGELCTAHDYRNGGAFAGRDVLVVGTGNTGTEIAVDLVEHGARRVRLAVRTVPHIVRRNTGPIAAQYTGIAVRRLPLPVADWLGALTGRLQTPDLSAQGLPRPDTGILTRVVRDNAIPVQDVGIIDAIRSGRVEPVAALAGFDGAEVELADGSRIEPDAVILATGYTQGLAPLIGHLGVLDDKGHPGATGARTLPEAPGLYYTGFTNPISGMLREIAIDSTKIAISMSLARAAARQAPPSSR